MNLNNGTFLLAQFIVSIFTTISWQWYSGFVVLSGISFASYRYWIWKEKIHELILDKKVAEKTTELADEKQQLWNSYIKIEHQNQEKNVLIQEVHHRVKNNLQTISSLIGMQLMTIGTDEGKKILQETLRRINAMSLVHEMLYSSDSLSHISSQNFLEVLSTSSLEIYDQKPINMEFTSKVIDVELEVSTCISLGMIISEAISNCMKHAFHATEYPTLHLNLSYADRLGWLSLCIKDNGSGIPTEYLNGKKGTMGMRLLHIFARQLNAGFQVENSNGTSICLQFKINNHENPDR